MSPAEAMAADLLRRIVVGAMALAASRYRGTSYDDALAVRDLVLGRLAEEMTRAGDAGEDAVYLALRRLRDAVVSDFNQRGATLARLREFAFSAPIPALTMAQQLYRDAGRSAELVREADPIHPAFMPLRVRALAT